MGRLREEMLRKEQENERMTFALAAEKEERERAQRKVHAARAAALPAQQPHRAGTSQLPAGGLCWHTGPAVHVQERATNFYLLPAACRWTRWRG